MPSDFRICGNTKVLNTSIIQCDDDFDMNISNIKILKILKSMKISKSFDMKIGVKLAPNYYHNLLKGSGSPAFPALLFEEGLCFRLVQLVLLAKKHLSDF